MAEIKLTLAQKTKAKILTEGLKIPKASCRISIDATSVLAEMKKSGVKLDSIFLAEMARIIFLEMPELNVRWSEEESGPKLRRDENLNFGLALEAKNGLAVVTIKGVEKKNFWEIDREVKGLADKAATGRLDPVCFDPLPNIVFNNVGIYPNIEDGDSLLQPWNTLMVSAFRIIETPIVFKGYIMIRPMMNVAAFFDHRSIDGKAAAKFLNLLKEKIKNPWF